MTLALQRPTPHRDPGRGLLRSDLLQMAYATTDMAEAKALFADRYGVTLFQPLGGPLPEGGEIHVEFGWAGGIMYELLHATGPGSDVYMEGLPAAGFGIRHHHLGFLIHSAEEWQALRGEIVRSGWPVRIDAHIEGFIHQIFVEPPGLGHLLEYLWPEQAGLDFFNSVPAN